MEFIARQVETNLHNAGMKDTDKIASRHGRSLSTQKNKYINISITEIAAELEVPPTTAPIRAAEPPVATLAPPTPQIDDDVSSVYSRTPSSRCKDYKNFLTGKLSSSKNSSRATSTTSKRSTREFMSSMSSYPWITGTSSGLTSSAASSVSSRRSEKSSKDNEKKKRGDTTPFVFPILSGCV